MINPSVLNILELIPQRPPMVMIDNLTNVSDNQAVSTFFIKKENIFCENGFLLEAGVIENIAQTAAAMMGYKNLINNRKNNIGFIGSIKNLKLHFLPVTGSILNTKIEVTAEIFNAMVIYGRNDCNGKIVAECEMKIFLNEE